MTPEQTQQLAAIRERRATYDETFYGVIHSDHAQALADIDALLAHIAAVTAERDEAEANIGEVNQLLADTLSRTKIAEQQVERLTADLAAANARADGERANYEGVMDDVRGSLMKHGRCDSGKDYGGLPKACAACMAQFRLKDRVAKWKGRTIRVAGLVARGEHEKGGGDGRR